MTGDVAPDLRLRNADLPAVGHALRRLAAIPLPAPTAARIARLARAVGQAAADLQARRDRLVDAHAARDAQGRLVPAADPDMRQRGMVRIDPDRAADFEKAVADALDETVRIPGPPLRVEELRRDDGRPVNVPAAVLMELGPLFDG